MDKPMGPRQPPPDKRHAAYESIFGRPGPSHHLAQPYNPYPYPDRRTSYQPSHYYPQPPPQAPYNGHTSYPSYGYQAYQPSLAPPSNQSLSRARSVNSASPDYIPPQISEPSGLTPAQAYQAQVYMNGPNLSQSSWNGGPRPSPSHKPNGIPPPDLPKIGISLEHDDGRLGIDFTSTPHSSDADSSSELPWANSEPEVRQKTSSFHHRQPSTSEHVPPVVPLHVDTFAGRSSAAIAPSPSPSSIADHSTASSTIHSAASSTLIEHASNSHRRSSDSARTMPKFNNINQRRDRTSQDRSMSMSAARPLVEQQKRTSGRASPNSIRAPPLRKTPVVYPALLSRVAQAFRERIPLTDRVKDGLTYKDAFDGREAVDKIAYIIRTTDRNLALLLGRALDAQKFFHDVTYDHRLRDSANELYQFQTKLPSPFVSGELQNIEQANPNAPNPALFNKHNSNSEGESGSPSPSPASPQKFSPKELDSSDELPLPSGVFTLLTDCYSPTCSRDQLCYSIACPRRLEQQARLNMKPQPVLEKADKEDITDVPPDAATLWIHSVPQEIVNNVSDSEKKRQEAINEVIYTERDFVRDMEYLRDVWINKLRDEDVIPKERRTDFLAQVFWNIHEIIAVNTRLRDALLKRQKNFAIVDRIGDIFMEVVPHFGPFVSYGAHQLYGKYEFEKEKSTNPAFAHFVEVTERLPESRKLELNAYLTKPTTRLARYPLLLEAVLKHTPNDSTDKHVLPKVVEMIREFLAKVNAETGKTENRFNLLQLDQQLMFKPGEEVDLRLRDEGREMVYKGTLNKRDGEIQVYLFDHAILFTKLVKTKQHEQYKVYRRPIPLELLLIAAPPEETNGTIRSQQRKTQALVRKSSFEKSKSSVPPLVSALPMNKSDHKGQHWINFVHLGRKYYNLMLWANSPVSHKKWLEVIYNQQRIMRERSVVFETVNLSEGFFSGPNKVNCAAPYSGGRRVVYGTDDGVYLSDLREPNQDPVKVLALLDVLQVDVLEDYQLLIVLSERQVITFPLEALDPLDPMAGLKRAKRISSHTSFFKAGFCLNKVLVCIVKSSQLSSTFKTLEPIDQNVRGRAKPTFKKLLQGGNDTLKLFREFYIPVESTSIHYLKTKMCVGCSRGFEIVDLESLDTQGLLDPNDESLEFVRKKENLRPMAIYRIHNDFLLCYDEFAFYVNKSGRRSRKEFLVHWEGMPTGFALHEPYVLAFEPSFVEIRHIETGLMTQVIQGSNLRLLFADTPPSVTNSSSMYQQPNPYHHGPPGPYNNPYAPYPQQQPYPHHGYPEQYPRHPQGVGREEILMVSDDRVLALRPRHDPRASGATPSFVMKYLSFLLLSALHLAAANAESINPRHRLLQRQAAVLPGPAPASSAPPPPPAASNTPPPPPPPANNQPAPTPSPSPSPPPVSPPPNAPKPSTPAAPPPGTTSAAPSGLAGPPPPSTGTTNALPSGPPPLATFTGVPPLSSIYSGMPTRTPEADTKTFTPGATPPISGAPVLPTPIGVTGWPTADQVPDTNSPQVQAWMKELDGYNIPNLSTTVDGSCASDPAAAADAANRGWWTCGGYTRDTDIVACPDKLTWGVSFDDGPAPYTQYLLDYLTEKAIKATFFVVGSRVVERPQLLIEEYMSGHEISVHTWSHRSLTTLTNEQIVAELGWTRKAIKDVLGITPTTMRPPYGDIDDRVRAIALAMGMVPIMWTNSPNGGKFDTNDWRVAGGQVNGTDSFNTFESILGNATTLDTGFIVLQHDLFEITVDLAIGYTLPAALNHDPKFNLMAIGQCQHFPAGNLYLETNQNTTFPYRNGTTASGVDVNGDGTPDTVSGGGGAAPSGTSGALSAFSAPLLSSLVAGLGMVAASLLL